MALARPFADPSGDDGEGAGRLAGLRALAERVAPTTLARDRTLPVLPALTGLVGAGLRRGATATVAGEAGLGATSLAFALVAAATSAGSWAAVVGLPAAHAPAAVHLGVALERLALVPEAATLGHWPTVVAALLDGVDLVVAAVPPGLRAPDARRLVARARERGSVLVPLLPPGVSWVEGADVRLRVTAATWHGLDDGHGFLQAREVEVAATGRGAAGRERSVRLWLPGHDGVTVVERAELPTMAVDGPGPASLSRTESPGVPRRIGAGADGIRGIARAEDAARTTGSARTEPDHPCPGRMCCQDGDFCPVRTQHLPGQEVLSGRSVLPGQNQPTAGRVEPGVRTAAWDRADGDRTCGVDGSHGAGSGEGDGSNGRIDGDAAAGPTAEVLPLGPVAVTARSLAALVEPPPGDGQLMDHTSTRRSERVPRRGSSRGQKWALAGAGTVGIADRVGG